MKKPHLTLNISQINTPASPPTSVATGLLPGSYKNNYCLYKKEIEREIPRSPGPDLTLSKGEEVEVKLQIEYTDLDSNEEKNLQKYIIHKANRNLIYNNGQIGILPTIANKPASSGMTICYYSLLEVTGIPNDDSSSDAVQKQDYIICLICEVESDEGFALFRSDLCSYCEKIQELLTDVKVNKADPESLQDHLSSWYSYTIEYISRCIDTAQEKLAVIIHAALMEKTIYLKKQAGQNAIVEDISKFIKCLSLSALVNGSALVENKQDNSHMYIIKDNENPTIDTKSVIIFIDSMYNLQIKYEGQPNVFAVQLAEELRNLPKDPLTIRNVLEQQKLKVLQELNQLRKGLEQARLNNYALYRCYRLLKSSENADVLMALLSADKGDPVSVEVLEVLQKCFSSA